ncbi:DUF1488 domain-containing protein [Xanthobacter dioxanivorans]|uniref:DUF1488 domain-containing protein n=1 Tax=Xanthobacter dioxanivorans TaxID=2528964 RepID=A0A974SHN8_9HYPH|nr:DUF1488 domain-containing protein [Xanthobacter dioxanivorans]QRG04553.1 DUF1488 domain-containing protein [Xanthobacter dioxanivorans]
MSLQFLNASRVYDPTRRCVTFWGHDSTFEISFHVDVDVLHKFSPGAEQGETASLRAFDVNRTRIERVAGGIYARRRQNFNRLSVSDF